VNRILIVEDEPRIASFLDKGLRANGFATAVAATGNEALQMAAAAEFELLILDLGLPDKDGFAVLRELRALDSRIRVVILTARSGVTDTVAGLEGGADDYVPKPFRFEELLARVRLRLAEDRTPEDMLLRVGDLALNLRTRRLQAAGRAVELTAREFALAETFFRHPGQVLSREQLLSHVWGYDHDPGSNIVDVYVGYLRKKTGSNRISTVRGMGYRLQEATPADEQPGAGRVLLIEDDARIVHLITKAMAQTGAEVVVAEDGEVAVFMASAEPFDGVVLDIGLPGRSGLEVLRTIRQQHADLPVVVLTSRDQPDVRRACRSAGASRLLTGPFTTHKLREAVLGLLWAERPGT
jgi:two-component system copper resistance phosphate regulon response regulator CusR